jgi:succinyl-CoA synthetase beta subunit
MNLLEYEAKQILKNFDITVPPSTLLKDNKPPVVLPVVLKSQVPVGGRGKFGGIRVVSNDKEFETTIKSLETLKIKGCIPSAILAEEIVKINKELYLSLLVDRSSASILLVASKDGGIDVEDNSNDTFLKINLSTTPNFENIGQTAADWYNLPEKSFAISDLIEKLHTCFVKNDATLIEINPLVLTDEGALVATDCKMTLDESARFRHPEWSQLQQQPSDSNFIVLNERGTVATIANGAGLAMATVDAVYAMGLEAANFLDIGGGADEASVLVAFERIVKNQSVKAIVINIFAGITRCDEVARAIISARSKIDNLPPLFIRLSGTNSELASQLLSEAGIEQANSLAECISSAKEVIS